MSDPAPPLPAGSEHSELALRMDGAWSQLQHREFAAAYETARALRASHPNNRDVLFLLAVSLRHLGRPADALEALGELQRHHPRFGRLFEERGLCHLAQRDLQPAMTAFSTAVTLNPWLPVSWSALQRLHRKFEQPRQADEAARSSVALAKLPNEIRTAHGLFADGDIGAAEHLVRRYLGTHPDHIEALRLLARIAMAHEVPRDAQLLLERVLQIAPEYHAARYEYARALLRRLNYPRAREELETLLALEPDNSSYRLTHATACARLGDLDQALREYQALLTRTPDSAEVQLAIGHALKSLGRSAEAAQSYRAAAAAPAGYATACWHLATLSAYRFEEAELERMIRKEADADTSVADRYHLCFALGKALEDRGQYARSFEYYARGNALRKREGRFRPELLENLARLQAATCTPEFFAERRGWGCADAAPIFIVGLPRCGSTLIEQILAAHSAVEGTLELPNIAQLVADLQGRTRPGETPHYPGALAELSRDDCRRLGEQYIRATRVYRHGKPLFIDKCLSNFQDLGFIHLILPNARIIDARRDPIACCFSNFKQLFLPGSGPEFAYDFADLARYYRMYLGLMRHWDAVLPGRILRVQYEDLVTDFPASVRRMLEFCALSPEPGCLRFYATERAVHTLSAEQVRRPIDRAGLDHWRHFEPWLAPLQDALASLAVTAVDPPTSNTQNDP